MAELAAPPTATPAPPAPRRWPAWATVLAFAAALGLALVAALAHLRAQALDEAQRRMVAVVQVIAEQASRTLQATDLRLQIAATRLDGLAARGLLTPEAASELLRAQKRDLPFVRGLWVLDAQGRLDSHTEQGSRGASFADREYFQVHSQGQQAGFFVGPAVRSRITGQWQVTASRPLHDARGAFAGVIVAALDPAWFEPLWRDVDIGEQGFVALFRTDAQLLVRSPPDPSMTGQRHPSLALFTRHLPRAPSGQFTARGSFDGMERLAAYRTLADYPGLVVVVGAEQRAVLAGWRGLALLATAVWALGTAVALLLSLLLQREKARLRQSEAQVRSLNAGLEEMVAQRTGELERQQRLFRTLAENAPQPFWTVDPRGAATFLSGAWYELVGGEPPRWQGYEWMEVMHPQDLQAFERQWVRDARTQQPHSGRRRVRGRDGRWHTMAYRALPVRDADGSVQCWVGIDVDITEIIDNEAALRLVNGQLQAFSYTVSHDLQAPLQRIRAFADLLAPELREGPGRRGPHFLARIVANADYMSQLVGDLLALAQVAELEMVCGHVSVTELAQGAVQRLQAADPQRQVHCTVAPGLAVHGDVRLVRSVVDNLLDNAWKFTSRTDGARIEVGGEPESGSFWVRDNGAGFDMAYADQLFGTFRRLHRDDEFPGTGIGLATVARAVQRQGGRVRAEGRPGAGATFFVTLPAPQPGAQQATIAAP